MKAGYKTTQLQGVTDLTVLARVKTGFIPGAFNTITYADRLTTVLRALNSIRQASREAALVPSPFADSVGRFRGIHFFRFAVMPAATEPGPHQLLLNVTFDGGWEPYMRIIWGPLGNLLDLMFCNCEGYPMAFQSSFDDYMRWVRDHEVPSSFFYTDSAATVADSHYLRNLDDLHGQEGGSEDFDKRVAGLALADPPAATLDQRAVETSLRLLKALAALLDLYPTEEDTQAGRAFRQDHVPLRFAQDLLRDLHKWIETGKFGPKGTFPPGSEPFKHELTWLMTSPEDGTEESPDVKFSPADVQAGIAERYPNDVRHGVLVLLRIKNVDMAKAWLRRAPVTPEDGKAPADGIYRSLALTYTGLKHLKVPEQWLDDLPHEFIAGMEARAGVLGDVRCNHPEHWRRPKRNWPPGRRAAGPPIDLSSVHVLVQLRSSDEDEAAADGATPVESLAREVDELDKSDDTGLEVLFVQPMRLAKPQGNDETGRDHFGYVDGISQPSLSETVPPPSHWKHDRVKTGDLFLGYPNSRGDKPAPIRDSSAVFDNGTFLVVRKLRQFPDRLKTLVEDAAEALIAKAAQNPSPGPTRTKEDLVDEIRAKLMGRGSDGVPLTKQRGPGNNDFEFGDDSDGGQCPHRSHIRRANPRKEAERTPRIMRRGMSYGPPAGSESGETPRGIVFMAYNASIAEQFEVIQRWLTGGNSSGLSSTQDDALLGVPEAGRKRAFRYVNDKGVVRVDLGSDPLVQLEWGLYAFVPSITALQTFGGASARGKPGPKRRSKAKASRSGTPLEEIAGLNEWRLLLEDDLVRAKTWKQVRDKHKGVLNAEGYGLLVGSKAKALKVLKDDGGELSVRGYRKPMRDSVGHGYLGMDDVGDNAGHAEQAPDINDILETVKEPEAFDAAYRHARKHLSDLLAARPAATVDLVEFPRKVLALLCTEWFGLPDANGLLMKHGTKGDDQLNDSMPRCPGHFLTVSRSIFSPYPAKKWVSTPAKKHGKLILGAVRTLLEQGTLTGLVEKIVNTPAMRGKPERQARTVAGVMLGFPPTVLGNLVSVLWSWNASLKLWDLQQDMPAPPELDYETANAVLRRAFLETMSTKPVPYAIWRTAMRNRPLGNPGCRKGDKVVVGLGSAVADAKDENDWMLMFGGARKGAFKTTHACPGYEMAMGVMLGCVAALLTAGTLTQTGSPRVLQLTSLAK